MDKNKNKTDLLAAGRKKFQQFRKKKETKGSSHGKSSNKTSQSDHEVDGELAPAADKPSALPVVADGEAASPLVANVEPIDVSNVNPSLPLVSIAESIDPAASQARVNSVALDVDVSSVNSSISPVVAEPHKGETVLASDSMLQPVDLEKGKTLSTLDAGTEREVDVPVSLVMGKSDMESITSSGADVGQFNLSATSAMEVMVREEFVDDAELVPVDLLVSFAAMEASEGFAAPVQMDVSNCGEEKVSFPSQEHFPIMSLTQAREDQEADGLGLNQCYGNDEESHGSLHSAASSEAGFVKVELERDGRFFASKHADTGENFKGPAADGEGTEEATNKVERTSGVDGVSVYILGTHELERSHVADCPSFSAETSHKAEGTSTTDQSDPELMSKPEGENVGAVSSNEKIPSPSCDLRTQWNEWANADMELDRTDDEVCQEQYLPVKPVVQVSNRHEKPLEEKTKSLYSGRTLCLGSGIGSIDLYQLAEGLRGVDEDEFRFLIKLRGSSLQAESTNMDDKIVPEDGFVDVLESLKEQLYLTNVVKDFLHLQLAEQTKLQVERDWRNCQLVDEVSKLSALLQETQENNTSLSKELAQFRSEFQASATRTLELETHFLTSRANFEEVTVSTSELHAKLGRSQEELTNMLTELAECKGFLASLQMENANLNGNLMYVTEERKKLEDQKEYFLLENKKLSSELVDYQDQLAVECGKYMQLEDDLKEAIVCLEQLTEENMFLSSILDIHKEKVKEIDNEHIHLSCQVGEGGNQIEGSNVLSMVRDNAADEEKSHQIPDRCDGEIVYTVMGKSVDLGVVEALPHEKLKREGLGFDFSVGLVVLKGHLEEADKVMQKLEKAIEGMHSHSTSLIRSGGKVAASGVSKLIQAFESKVHHEDSDSEEVPPIEGEQPMVDPFKLAKEQIGNMKSVLKVLDQDAEKANELFEEEQDKIKLANVAFRELEVLYEALKQQTSNLEEENGELKVQCESSKQQNCSLEVKNNELIFKLTKCQSRIGDLESQLHEIHEKSDEMATMIFSQVENLQKEVGDMASNIEQEWYSTVAAISKAVETLFTSIGKLFTHPSPPGPSGGIDFGFHVAASLSAATKAFEDLHEKLELAYRDYESIHSSYEELNEKFSNLHARNELAVGLLDKIYRELRKLINDSIGDAEGNELNVKDARLFDLLQPHCYEALIEQLGKLLGERLQLQSAKNEFKSELMNRLQDIEELNKRCLDSKSILKLVKDVGSLVKMDGVEIDSDNPPFSLLESSVSVIIQKYREASEQVSLSREEFESKVIELSELQGKMHQISSLNLRQEDEIRILKGSLSKMEETLEAVHSELQAKVSELEQSEQRVSLVREKLSIAVAKGKGLIVQRDSLKQSLAEISTELEHCSQDLQHKDARLREVETKLQVYSEAGERVEALESELSYIRNSAAALRESFLLKDSVLQRIEEILEDLELPEHFHSRDIIEKIEWLARSVTGNSLPLTDWDQKSSVGGGSYSDAGFVVMDAWKEEVHPNSNSGDDLKRKYEELQSSFYGLAEQNEMLEQSLMERNNLVHRWEEVLDRINMPSQLRSMEPEDRIEWLGNALSEAHHDRDLLEQKIENLETYCGSLTAELEELQRKLSNLEAALLAVTQEKELLSASLENFTSEHEKVSKKAIEDELEKNNLRNELSVLQEKIVEKLDNEEYHHHIEVEIRKLQVLVSDALQVHDTEDVMSGVSNTECLEGLLRKLIDNYTALSLEKHILKETVKEHIRENAEMVLDEWKIKDAPDAKEWDTTVLKEDLDEALGNLAHVTEERDAIMEKHQSLVYEFEALGRQRDDLQERLNQEEQKLASTREKLNVAVRKGKGLVQQRDTLKQTIEEMNTKVEHLKSELNHRDNALVHYEKNIKDLSSSLEKAEALESEKLLLRNRLEETEHSLQLSGQTLTGLLNTLHAIDIGDEFNNIDPVQKLDGIGKLCRDLHGALASSKHEAEKSKRAANLLLSELNEVHERIDDLQAELAKTEALLAELSRERDVAESARIETLSRLEKLINVQSEERKNQFAEVMKLKASIDQLWKVCFGFNRLLADAFSNDLKLLHDVETSVESFLKQIDGSNVVVLPLLHSSGGIFSNNSLNEVKFPATGSLSEKKMQDQFDNNNIVEALSFLGNGLQECMIEFDSLKEKFYKHSISFDQQAKILSKVMETVHRELASQKESMESMARDIMCLDSMKKDKDTEIFVMHRNIAMLYEACTSAILEIEKQKDQMIENGLVSGVCERVVNLRLPACADGREPLDGQALAFTEEHIRTMADNLLVAVKGSASIPAEIVAGSQKELKSTILNLQKEVQEKDIQGRRICAELVSQIKEAEAVAASYLLDLESAKTQVHTLEKTVETMEKERNLLELRLKELQDGESSSKKLQERIRSLTDMVTAKEQEIEALMQALDEEESQMEGLTNNIDELEKVVQQKNLALENLDASRGKAMAKLSITVSKFDELHQLSENLLSEVENLQSQLQGRDAEISFLRQEVTRCTNDVLAASQENNRRISNETHELARWLGTIISRLGAHDEHLDDKKLSHIHAYKEILEKQITSIASELENLQAMAQSRDALLQAERSKVEELLHKEVTLENSLREKETQLALLQGTGVSSQATSTISTEILEVEPMMNKRTVAGTSIAPNVRSLRKVNNDQVSIGIDMDPGSSMFDDVDDDKVHGFKSLTTSRIVPRFTRPVTDMIDGLWVSCDRALMRQPGLRLGIIIYWAVLHTLLAMFIV